MTALVSWTILLTAGILAPLLANGKTLRQATQFFLGLAGVGLLIGNAGASPPIRLLFGSVLLLVLMKGIVLLAKPRQNIRATSTPAYAIFFTVWPGMAIEGFHKRRCATPEDVRFFGRGLFFVYTGCGLFLADVIAEPSLSKIEVGAICVLSILLAVHFGFSEVLTALIRYAGWPVEPLFKSPEKSATLEDFWGRRWNLPFVEMDRRLFVRPLIRLLGPARATAAVFVISGLFHEIAISYPAGAGWGLLLSYFVVQATGAWLQSRGALKSRLWTYAIVLLPLPLLFHPAFLERLPFALVHLLHGCLIAHPLRWYMNILLWALGIAQLLPLAASFQVPARLNWKEELPKLSALNRKLMWTYGAFVVLTILAFAILTLTLHNELLRGDRAALAFAMFAAIYWGMRLLADSFILKPSDWPKGAEFTLGHGLLASLFAFLTLGYTAVVFVHL